MYAVCCSTASQTFEHVVVKCTDIDHNYRRNCSRIGDCSLSIISFFMVYRYDSKNFCSGLNDYNHNDFIAHLLDITALMCLAIVACVYIALFSTVWLRSLCGIF